MRPSKRVTEFQSLTLKTVYIRHVHKGNGEVPFMISNTEWNYFSDLMIVADKCSSRIDRSFRFVRRMFCRPSWNMNPASTICVFVTLLKN